MAFGQRDQRLPSAAADIEQCGTRLEGWRQELVRIFGVGLGRRTNDPIVEPGDEGVLVVQIRRGSELGFFHALEVSCFYVHEKDSPSP